MDPTLDGQQSLAHTSVSEQTLQPTRVLEHVQRASTGAAVLFVGLVRNHDGGRGVNWLEYSSHPSADDVLREVTAEILDDHPHVQALSAHHRIGRLDIGDVALVAVVSSSHRAASFRACEDLVERVKARIPIWKRQVFTDGDEEWVNSP